MGVKLWPGSTFPLALACGKMGLLRSFVCTRRNCLPTSISFIMDAQSGRLRGVFLYCSSLTATCSGISFSIHKFQSAKVSFHSFRISAVFFTLLWRWWWRWRRFGHRRRRWRRGRWRRRSETYYKVGWTVLTSAAAALLARRPTPRRCCSWAGRSAGVGRRPATVSDAGTRQR